ncbi:C protein alpha-antigen precursor [Gemella haemolysans]|uniref:YPDG domain-containing protein n=1 Tax=Gemella haemolysans TaxID=1379 RepID=UPI000F7054A2|nr:YPDG domain-containing protein [Gemella haemolysans]VEI38254.1 C protein alpha-antigen precursor [Gemella haemolysans]
MIGKNNQKLKNKKEGVKIESYSIKKFKVGAASVVIGASIFFGAAGIANAGEVSGEKTEKNIAGEKANSSNDEKTDVLNNKISTEKEVKKPIKKEEVSTDATPAEKTDANADKKVEKKALDKNTLKTNIEKVEELLEKINKEKASASTLAAIKIDLENAKNILNSTSAELTQAEIDALAKKLSEKIFVLSSMPKANTPEKVVKEGENTIANTGSRDSRNRQSIGEGTHFRADGQVSSGALANIKYFASVDPNDNGGRRTRNNEPEFTKNKTDIKAYYVQDSEGKWIVYDVFFNNDGRKMTGSSYQQHYYFQAPFNIMDPSNTVKDLTFTRYRNTGGRRLSDGFQGFEQYGNTATITNPWSQQYRIFNADRDTFYDPNSGVNRDNQRWDVFKNNQYDPTLNQLPKDKNGNYPRASYHLGLDVRRESTDYAVHMHAKIKLKNDITEAEANAYGRAYAASVTKASGTNQSYIMGTLGTSLTPRDTTPPTITANNATVTSREQITPISVTAEDNRGGVGMRDNNPIEVSGLPSGLTYANNRITGTPTGAPGNSTVTIKAYDKNGNMATKTITITVRSQADTHNPTGAGLTVNQGQVISDDAVKAKVSNYAPGTLTVVSKPSTANPGNVGNAVVKVTYPDGSSENVNVPVTVLEAPDTQAPTLAITPANQTVVEGQTVTFIVTARDNKIVNLDANDFLTKYGTRVFSGKASVTSPTDTDTEKIRRITITTTAEDVGKTNTITFNATDNANHRATPVSFTFTVTKRDNIPPTITAGDATVTSREQITPISVTAVDNPGGVGLRDNNPIEVTGLPAGLTYANNRITGTPTGAPGNSTVTIKAHDKNGNTATKTITITVRSQADAHNPTGTGLTVNQNHTITDAELKAKVSNFAPGTLSIVSKPSTATAGNAGNAVVKVTYPDGTFDNVNVPVTVTDVIGPTITANNATVTSREQITPIPVTAVDNTGGVGMRQNNPIEVTGLPAGLTYSNGRITGTPTGPAGNSTVTIKAYDRNNTPTTKTITITVRSQADVHNPTGSGLTVNQNHTITDAELKAKVSNFAPGTLSIVSKPSTTRAGSAGNAVVKVTYPDGTFDNVNVPVTVTDVTGPTIKASGATVTNREPIPEIPVTAVDNTGGVGMRDNNPIVVTDLPAGLTFTNGKITGTPTGTAGTKRVTITAYDKNNTPTTKVIEIVVQEQKVKYNPTGETLTVPYNHKITDDEVKVKVQNFGPGTLTVQSKPSTNTSGNVGNAVVIVTYPDGSTETVDVPVVVGRPNKDDYTPKYNDGSGKPGESVGIPVSEANGKTIPAGTTYTSLTPGVVTVDGKGKVTVTIPADKNPGDKVTGKVLVRYPDGSEEEVPVTVTVVNRDKDDYTPKYNDGSGKPGESVGIPVSEANGKTIPAGTTYTSLTPGVVTVDDKGKVTVTIPADKNPGDKVTGKVLVRYPDGSEEEVPVTVTVVNRDKDDYTPKYNDGSGKPGESVGIPVSEANGKTIPAGTTYTSLTPGVVTVDDKGKVTVTIPADKNPGDKVTGKVLVRYPDGSEEEVPVTVTVVNRDKDDYTPKYNDGNGKPGASVDIPVSEANGKTIPAGTTYTSLTPGVVTVDDKGKVTVTIPADKNPGDKVTGKVLVRYPDGSEEEVPVTVTVVNRDKDDYTPKYNDGSGKPGESVGIPVSEANGKTIPAGTTYTSLTPGVVTVDDKGKVTVTIPADKNPGDKVTGKVLVRYPDGSEEEVPVTVTVTDKDKDIYTPKYEDGNGKPGTKVEIPLKEENGKEIPAGTTYTSLTPGVVTVDDKGKVTVTIPADKNPGDKVTGKVLVRYPDGSEEEVPVTVTVTDKDKDIYTPKYEDGNGKPGTKVEIPLKEENGKEIPTGTTYESDQPGVITVDDKGKVTVTIPEGAKPGDKITGKVLVRYPDGSTEEVPVTVTVGEQDKDIYTPKYDEGKGKPGSKVEIPLTEENGKKIPTGTTFESDKPGIITVDKDGKVTVTIPEGAKPGDKVTGKVTVTYPDGSKEDVPVNVTVTTPAKLTPTVELEQNPNTGDVTVTPKKPDGSTYPPGTKVEIPGKNGNTITVTIGEDGKGTVPNSDLPDRKVPGVARITEPGKPTVEVPVVTTPAKLTPTVELEQDPKTGDVTVTPKKPDGSIYPPGTKVEIPGKDGNTITVTIGEDGKGTVPNNDLPEGKVPGVAKITEPGKPTVEVPVVTTPAKLTPTVELEQDPKTGDVTVTPKKPDGSTYPPGTKVEIPGKDGNTITVTIGEDGKGTVPNNDLPEGKVPGVAKITEPGKLTVEVPVVTTPAKLTPTVELEQNPNTGDVTVTPKKPDGSTYPPGTKVEIPGKNGNTITVTIGEDGKGTVPNNDLPDGKVPGVAKITEPGKPTVEVPVVTTPAKLTPTVELEQNPNTGDVTVTPKKPDGSTYPPGTKVEIPGKNGNTITVTIGEDGKGTVPNNDLPDVKVPGVAKITEPGKPTVEVPVVTMPAKLTPTVELEQNPNTGDVTVTPKKPDGSTYPPGTKVEIPGKNGNIITVTIGEDGKGTVPNNDLPDVKVPGVARITEPGKPTVEVPVVTTPAKLTPTVELEQDPKTGDVTVTPKKPDGSTYPPGTKVEIPGKNGNTITVTIGEDGKGTVPNSDLPDVKVPGVARITEPGKPTVEVPVVTTPAKIRASEKGELQSQKLSDNKENPTVNKSTKRLANTGESETNTGLAGLGLAMLGSLLAVAKKRREDKE